MSLADYLASKYLKADPSPQKPSKKRKRKSTHTSTTTGLVIADDNEDLSLRSQLQEKSDDEGPLNVSDTRSAEFRKAKNSTWKSVGAPPPSNADQAAADAIIASAAAENAAARDADEDAPQILDEGDEGVRRMKDGAAAGLQTAAQTEAAVARRKKEEARRMANTLSSETGKGQETIYRDASGRVINVAMKRAEARKKAEDQAAKEAAAEEAQKGDVQRAQTEARRQELRDAKYLTVARGVDDVEMNDELRERERWDDPAAMFLTEKKGGKKMNGGKLAYEGPAAPNRYGIRPGYRWDGVDRGNGFESEWFKARNRKANVKELEYAWQMDE